MVLKQGVMCWIDPDLEGAYKDSSHGGNTAASSQSLHSIQGTARTYFDDSCQMEAVLSEKETRNNKPENAQSQQ